MSYPGDWLYNKSVVSDKDDIFISKEVTRNSFLKYLNDEIPYLIKVMNHKWKNINRKEIAIHQNILVNDSRYNKIILGKNGNMIKKIRENTQTKLSKIFNKKIHLYLELINKE